MTVGPPPKRSRRSKGNIPELTVPKRRGRGKAKPPRADALLWREAFLVAFRNSGNVLAACRTAGGTRRHVYKWRKQNAAFAREWREAEAEAFDLLAASARKRAMEGSDTLLIYLLKVHGGPEWRQDRYAPLAPEKGDQGRGLAPPPSDAERVAEVVGILASLGLLPALAPRAVAAGGGDAVGGMAR